jgi:hypothetical protein
MNKVNRKLNVRKKPKQARFNGCKKIKEVKHWKLYFMKTNVSG